MIKNQHIKRFAYKYIFPYVGLLFIKAISLTYRFRFIGVENEQEAARIQGGPLVYAGWHQRLFHGITAFLKRKPIAIIISESRDGEFIARIVRLLGWRPVRGSSSRGGTKAYREVKAMARTGYNLAHIVDGPQGPPGIVKPGLMRIARATGMPVLPVGTSAQRRWVFNSWDRFMLPKPFSRIIFRFGKPIHVGRGTKKDELEKARLLIEDQLKVMNQEADQFWIDPAKVRQVFK